MKRSLVIGSFSWTWTWLKVGEDMAKKIHDKQAREPDWLKRHRNWRAATDEFEQLQHEVEAKFKAELEAVPIVGDMLSQEQRRTDDIGFLMDLFSTGRFMPDHWQKFGLPNLAKEAQWLGLGTRAASLEKILTQDEFRRLSDKVNGILSLWTDWRKRACQDEVEIIAWDQRTETHAALESEWEEVTWWINELQRFLEKLAVTIDDRINTPASDGCDSGSNKHDKRPQLKDALFLTIKDDPELKKKLENGERLKKGELDDLMLLVNERLISWNQGCAKKGSLKNVLTSIRKELTSPKKKRS